MILQQSRGRRASLLGQRAAQRSRDRCRQPGDAGSRYEGHHRQRRIDKTTHAACLRQQALDVVQLHKCLLESVLNISEQAIRNQENVSYCREAADALQQVRSGKAQAAFLMNPVRMSQVRDIAFAGEVLPQKSTDFYPKLLSGLTIYALE